MVKVHVQWQWYWPMADVSSGRITPIQTQDPELISRLKESLPEILFEKLSNSLSSLEDRLERLQRENRLLRELRRLDLLGKYGPSAETLSGSQLELLELKPGVSRAEVEAESQREQLTLPLKTARKHPGRQQLPAGLPRKEQIVVCPADQCVCGKCGEETTVIGYETSEQLDVEPAKFFVRVNARSAPVKLVKNKECSLRRCQPESSTKAWPVIEWSSTRW
jgi:hypothetical protein